MTQWQRPEDEPPPPSKEVLNRNFWIFYFAILLFAALVAHDNLIVGLKQLIFEGVWK